MQVSFHHLNTDLVAEHINLARMPSAYAIVFLVIFEVVILQLPEGNHPFALVLNDFDIDTPLGHSGDDTLVHFPDSVTHVLYLFVLD